MHTIRLSHTHSYRHCHTITVKLRVTVTVKLRLTVGQSMCLAAQPLLPGHDQTYSNCRCALRRECTSVCLSVYPPYLRTYEQAQVRSGDTPVHCVQYTHDMWYHRARLIAQLFMYRRCKSPKPPTNLHYLQTKPTYNPSHTTYSYSLQLQAATRFG
jgi:hypothetical protein